MSPGQTLNKTPLKTLVYLENLAVIYKFKREIYQADVEEQLGKY